MTRKDVLEYILLVAILINVHAQVLSAYDARSHVDSVPPVKPVQSPATPATPATPAADHPSMSCAVMSANIGMVWRTPGASNGIVRILSDKDVEAMKSNDGSQPEDKLRALMEKKAESPSSGSLASTD